MTTNLFRRDFGAFLLAIGVVLSAVAPAPAQSWRTEQVLEAGIEFSAPSRLERLPMQLGKSGVHHRARLRPKDNADFVRARYYWYCDVYEFSKKEQKAGEVDLPEGMPEEARKQLEKLLARAGHKQHKSFKEWLDAKKNIEIDTAGKKKRGRHGKLDYEHWVYAWDNNFGPVGITHCEAAVYDFEDRQVALVIEMPLEVKSGPKRKWKTIIKKMIGSGKALDPDDIADESDSKRDKYADTPEKKAALKAAIANIAGLEGWDYFTQPNYIVLYSWDFEKSDERVKAKKQAEFYSSRLEKMRELYIESYPLDASGTKAVWPDPETIPSITGPITGAPTEPKEEPLTEEEKAEREKTRAEKKVETPYSVFRLCATYDQFRKYGQSPPGVVGWYSPRSKELVVFLGGDKMMGKGATETVTYHEGWHQYADHYFHHPDSPKHAVLHRWFDEGHGDYFGSFRWATNDWKYVGSKMRYDNCREMVRKGDYVPFKEIVHWPRQRFYTDRGPYRYAQAYSMIDFMRRGHDARGFKQQWGEALDMYRKVTLVKGDTKLAVDTAFRGFTDEDWTEFEEAWKEWVQSKRFLNGR